ncbi:MAG: hypothetical protein M0P91_05420 [Sulfuricurvum sp.]|jgi:hypothetical protein|uniref:hypothetical protein n=1 Tax=Sulfuricurvum sp. TaxID=2025608 RepID=UPI0025D4DBC8|nr:hypothetical protein [Sulfuricurvum sp.]MCK9372616.1 hypothetical protein [Sulfuricurvum sp.]
MLFINKKTVFIILIILSLGISGCTSIQLISNYDKSIDSEAQQLQKKIDGHFISLQNATTEDLKYKNQQKFYEGVLADLNAIEIRANGIYKNKLTIEQINLAKENLSYLVLLHKNCVTASLSLEQIEKVKINGIDLSMDCKVENGATTDTTDRGEIAINRVLITPIQRQFNQHLGAVMALELAKKRGENKSEKE